MKPLFGLFYGNGELYGVSDCVNKLNQKKKDLDVLHEIAVGWANHCIKLRRKIFQDLHITKNYEKFELESKSLNNDENLKYSNTRILEVKVI